jgi:dimethylhistidine N-methyltransferase
MNVHVLALTKSSPAEVATTADAKAGDASSTFALDVLAGLGKHPKQLSPKYFYDSTGSDLFEQITRLPEYYPTRTELGILRDRSDEIATLLPQHAALVEFGAGATTKVRLLLETCNVAAYVPVDISADFLQAQARALRADFPALTVYPVAADFTETFALPQDVAGLPKVGFFPGSTIGNFEPHEAQRFLRRAAEILGRGALIILGVDLEKDEKLLHDAYNDAAGVTAKFNLNLMVRMNRELGTNFDLAAFDHCAIYNRELSRIEMHLISKRPQMVRVCGRSISFTTGESIHTENSYKYSIPRFYNLARANGWTPVTTWTDSERMFSVHALRAN